MTAHSIRTRCRMWNLCVTGTLHLSTTSIFRTFSGLIIAIIMTEPTLIGEGEERFITASHRLEKSIDFLEKEGGTEVDPQVVPLARQFIAFGNGESNFFDSLRHRLPLIASESELIEANQQIRSGLQVDIDELLGGILQDAVFTRRRIWSGGNPAHERWCWCSAFLPQSSRCWSRL